MNVERTFDAIRRVRLALRDVLAGQADPCRLLGPLGSFTAATCGAEYAEFAGLPWYVHPDHGASWWACGQELYAVARGWVESGKPDRLRLRKALARWRVLALAVAEVEQAECVTG